MCPSLRRVRISGPGTSDSFGHNEPITLHDRLTSFSLWNNTDEILQYLAFPALTELRFVNISSLNNTILLPFLSRTRGSLRYFAISHSPSALILNLSVECFVHTVHLTSLHLPLLTPESGVAFVRALNRHHAEELLPALTHLTLDKWNPDQVSGQLLDALDTRCIGSEAEDGRAARLPLESFRLVLSSHDTSSLVVQSCGMALRDLRRWGMEVHVGTFGQNYLAQ
ncbi:hypothetical protein B0H16DRAFT_5791 [Mycena metata]|uniref:Uncharacterized protein n=1 Tax=Mycena metata TaxID=1033252 RepID=A0AAD7P339_9AGAR|nr:hypothetical protein B0H16DRAFT_5791 [Mycena metata]